MAREQFQNLTEPMYYILLSLTTERHGYEIMQAIEEFTNGRVIIGPGTLYALLGRFEREGFISLVSEENRKKIYIITAEGKKLLDEEINRLKQLVEDGENILKDIDRSVNHMEEDKKNRASIFKRSNDDILY